MIFLKTAPQKAKQLIFYINYLFLQSLNEFLEIRNFSRCWNFSFKKRISNSRTITIEACENTLKKAKEGLGLAGIEADFHLASFEAYIKHKITGSFDIIYIDGHHDGNALLRYITFVLPYANPETMGLLLTIFAGVNQCSMRGKKSLIL